MAKNQKALKASRSRVTLADKVLEKPKSIQDFNVEQLKQTSRGVVHLVLEGKIGRVKANILMSLILEESFRRSDLKKGGG